jgi:hypothetical protein
MGIRFPAQGSFAALGIEKKKKIPATDVAELQNNRI